MLIIAACAALAIAGCGGGDDDSTTTKSATEAAQSEGSASQDTSTKPQVTVPDGKAPKQLEETDLVVGDGATAKSGDQVTVNYVGVGYDSEEEFDASWGRGPFTFTLGTGEVIPGWDEGVAGMKVGGPRVRAAGVSARDRAQRNADLRRRPRLGRLVARRVSGDDAPRGG